MVVLDNLSQEYSSTTFFFLQVKEENVENNNLTLISMETIQSQSVGWLWYPFIPYGKLTIVQGDPGEGKTTFVLNLAAKLSRGECFGEDSKREPITILYQTAEDGLADTIKPRLEQANADCTKIKVIDESQKSLHFQDERIEQAIIETGARLLIFDPLQAFLGDKVDMNRANETREVTKALGALAEKYGCAILLIGHMNKGGGTKAAYRGMGSIDFFAVARSVLLVARVPDDPTLRAIAPIKSNLAQEGGVVAFRLGENSFQWEGAVTVSVDDLLSGISTTSKKEKAENLVKNILEEHERFPSKEIYERGKQLGISQRTLENVKQELGIKALKEGNNWFWSLK